MKTAVDELELRVVFTGGKDPEFDKEIRMAAKKRKASGLAIFTIYVIFPLMLIDAYAFWRVHKSSENWVTGMLSFSEPLSQLAWILGVNIIVIFVLMIRCSSK